MLKFKRITIEDKDILNSYYNLSSYESCEYSTGIKLFWNKFYPYEYAISKDGALVIKYEESGNTVFDMPIPKEGTNLESILDEIDEYCITNAIVPVFSDVPEEYICLLVKRYNFTKIENFRESVDYIYKLEDLRDFKGRHYSGQRNHINKFKSLYPNYTYRELNPKEDLDQFFNEYYSNNLDKSVSYVQEQQVAENMAKSFSLFSSFKTGAIEVDGKLAAFCIGEILNNRVVIHIEKALTKYEGIYPLLVSEYLSHMPANIEYVNREDDSSNKGLRTSKMQYRPFKLLSKYVVLLQSELLYVDSIPSIQTERLILDEIIEKDSDIYQALCLDDERNKYWGYDYRKDLKDEYIGNIPKDYFLNIAKEDFAERMCLNLAIRKNGEMIGEIVLYEADYKGGIEVGCRLLKEYEGRGFGKEAILAASNWAIYKAGFRRVKAKCFKENIASFNMLLASMKQISEDDTFFYFEKDY